MTTTEPRQTEGPRAVPPADVAARWESDQLDRAAARYAAETVAYLRQIHWWVRLVGFIIVIPVILAVLVFIVVVLASIMNAALY